MATVEIAEPAVDDLEDLIDSHNLPADTRERVRNVLSPLEQFPQMGSPLGGRWAGFRYLVGPWKWMLLVYAYIEADDRVFVVTIQDAKSSGSATSEGR